MKFKRLVPLALALAIASTAAAEAARLPQNLFSFAVCPNYTQTVSRPSVSNSSQSTTANSSYAAQMVSLVNAKRTRQGLPALTEAGVSYARAVENIAYGQSAPEAVVQSWMSSSGHRANILSSSFTTIGVGCTVVNGTAYWAQLFTA